jgi:hypothetical protein
MATSPPIQDNELPQEAELEIKIKRTVTRTGTGSSLNAPGEIKLHPKAKSKPPRGSARQTPGGNAGMETATGSGGTAAPNSSKTVAGKVGMVTTPGSGSAAQPKPNRTSNSPAGNERLAPARPANSSPSRRPDDIGESDSTGLPVPSQTPTAGGSDDGGAYVSPTPIPERQSSASPTQPSAEDRERLSGGAPTSSSGKKANFNPQPQRNYVPRRGSSTGTRRPNGGATNDEQPSADDDTADDDQASDPLDLDRPEPVYDEPGVADDFDDDRPPTNPAVNPAAAKTDAKLDKRNGKNKDSPDRGELADDEKAGADNDKGGKAESAESDKLGRGFTGGGKNDDNPSLGSKLGTAIGGLLGTKRRKVIAGAFGGGLTGLLIALLVFVLPLKILHMIENLENKFFSSLNHSAQKEAETLTSQYLRRRMVVLRHCKGGIVDASCNPISKFNPIERAFRGMQNAKFEDTLAKKYNIQIRWDTGNGGHYYINNTVADDFVNGNMDIDEWSKANGRNEVRQAFAKAIENETGFKKVVLRYKVGRLLEQKYGIKRCLFWCESRDAFADNGVRQRTAFKLAFSQRVLGPRDTALKRLVDCLLSVSSSGCGLDPKPVECTEGVDCEAVGEALSDAEVSIQTELRAKALKDFGFDNPAKITDLEKFAADAAEKGWSEKEIQSFVTDITGKGTAADRIPAIGWVIAAAQIIDTVHKSGPTLKKLGYIANASSAVALYAMYRTTADECKSGHCNNDELGSMSASLDQQPVSKNSKGEITNKGGTASAVESPIYGKITEGSAVTKSPNYKCDDGKALLASGICPEEVLGQGNAIADTLTKILDTQPLKVVADIAGFINSAITKIFEAIGFLLSPILSTAESIYCFSLPNPFGGRFYPAPGAAIFCPVVDWIKEQIPRIIDFIVNHLIPNPFGDAMSGARTFNMMAAGADVSANDAVHSQLGGVVATPEQISALEQEQRQALRQQYFSQSFFARLFDTQSSYSPISKLAMATPSSATSASVALTNTFANPFSSLSRSFASLFSKPASAAAEADIFGVTQYYVPDEVYQKIGDQSKFWDEHCSDNPVLNNGAMAQKYAQASTQHIDENTGMPTNVYDPNDPYLGTNPCALIQTGACATGFIMAEDSCSSEDLGTDTDTATGPDSTSTTTSVPQGSSRELAKGLLERHYKGTINGHAYNGDGKYSCDNSGDCNDLDDTANGQSISGHGNCHVDAIGADVLQAVLILIEQKGYSLGTFALCSDHSETGHTRHTYGEAVDISTVNGHAVNTDAAEGDVISILRVFNGLIGQPLAPDQLLNQGVGNHYIAANDALSMDNHQSSPYFTSKYVGDHEDHIHVGY